MSQLCSVLNLIRPCRSKMRLGIAIASTNLLFSVLLASIISTLSAAQISTEREKLLTQLENTPGISELLEREQIENALANTRSLQQQIFVLSLIFGGTSSAMGWWIARSCTSLVELAHAAEAHSQTENELDSELEQRVIWRTQELSSLNEQLNLEVETCRLSAASLSQANQKLQQLVLIDDLTGIANRRRFDQYLDQEWRRLAREQLPLSLILCDIDYFKAYNDTYGHQAGDDCLKQVAQAIGGILKRPADLAVRYGGEEFVAILPNTNKIGAMYVASEVREALRALQIHHLGSAVSDRVTLSCGVATAIPTPDSSPQALIAQADRHLYQAKQGRDRIVG